MKNKIDKKDAPRVIAVLLFVTIVVILALTALLKLGASALAGVIR